MSPASVSLFESLLTPAPAPSLVCRHRGPGADAAGVDDRGERGRGGGVRGDRLRHRAVRGRQRRGAGGADAVVRAGGPVPGAVRAYGNQKYAYESRLPATIHPPQFARHNLMQGFRQFRSAKKAGEKSENRQKWRNCEKNEWRGI